MGHWSDGGTGARRPRPSLGASPIDAIVAHYHAHEVPAPMDCIRPKLETKVEAPPHFSLPFRNRAEYITLVTCTRRPRCFTACPPHATCPHPSVLTPSWPGCGNTRTRPPTSVGTT